MASNRHWPSMFKSKPCNPHHQWQHDINSSLMSSGCHRSPYTSAAGCEERSPEPKPRWNPKPEQIRILEAIFNSGMVNPPRDEIRKIRAQLQEYGQVGDANVFYWFQNRKSRSKHKLRHLQNSKNVQNSEPPQNPPISLPLTQITAPNSSSSSSSEISSPKELIPTKCKEWCQIREIMIHNGHGASKKDQDEDKSVKIMHQTPQLNFCVTPTSTVLVPPTPSTTITVPSPIISQVQGIGDPGVPARSTVFINDVAFEVAVGPFNVREAFGEDAVLIHATGQPVLTNQWGLTLQSLHHGASYYLEGNRKLKNGLIKNGGF
ncbi:Homeobox-like domain superfamily [Sesbania bispinosa]|nr:Homeobox-like domain superfamily [Sesbania bispinosa]